MHSMLIASPDAAHRTLAELCGGEIRYRVIRELFEQPGQEFHLRRLAANAKVDPGNAYRMLKRLVDAGLVEQVKTDLYPRYRARQDNFLYLELTRLFGRGSEFLGDLRKVAQLLDGYVAIFGSVARGRDRPESDLDVMVIGPTSTIIAQAKFKPVAREYRRKINATAADIAEVLTLLDEGSLFWREVLTGPQVPLKGEIPDEISRRLRQGGKQGIPAKSRGSSRHS